MLVLHVFTYVCYPVGLRVQHEVLVLLIDRVKLLQQGGDGFLVEGVMFVG